MTPSIPSENDSSAMSNDLSTERSTEFAKATASVEHNCAVWITRWAEERPQALAWVDDHRRCDYARAEDRIQRLAAWLAAHGVCPGDRVALWLGNRGAMLEAVFASARLGAIVVPINARLTAAEVSYQLDDATPCVLLVEREWRDRAEAAGRLMKTARPCLLEVGLVEDTTSPDMASDAYEQALASRQPTSKITYTCNGSRRCDAGPCARSSSTSASAATSPVTTATLNRGPCAAKRWGGAERSA